MDVNSPCNMLLITVAALGRRIRFCFESVPACEASLENPLRKSGLFQYQLLGEVIPQGFYMGRAGDGSSPGRDSRHHHQAGRRTSPNATLQSVLQ
jgi:hypothetical protein